MKKIFVVLFVLCLMAVGVVAQTSAQSGDCTAFETGSIPMLSSLDISFNCTQDTTVYVGVCDSGNVPNDDLFDVYFGGQMTSYNYYISGEEWTVLGEIQAAAGDNMAVMHSLNTTPYPPATYSYAISPEAGEVVNYLQAYCGADWQGIGPGISASCAASLPVFTTDKAPTDGTLEFHVLFGNEGARTDEIVFYAWDVKAGEQINQKWISNLPSPRYGRLWWNPDGTNDWYLLTSQYWQGGGTLADQYGISCQNDPLPSYHTSFASAVPEQSVCFDLPNGCR